MDIAMRIGNKAIDTSTMVNNLLQYRLLETFVRETITDDLISHIECDSTVAFAAFCKRRQLLSEEQQAEWRKKEHFTPAQMKVEAVREYRLQQFKEETWGDRIQTYFLQRKPQLDRVIYSLLRVKEPGVAQELYFRLCDDGVAFSELAKQYSGGQEAQTGGLVGPVELSVPHPMLAKMLRVSRQGQLWEPTKIGDWYIIVRFEKQIPAQLNEPMRQRLLNEQFQSLMQERLQASPVKLMPKPAVVTTAASDQGSQLKESQSNSNDDKPIAEQPVPAVAVEVSAARA